MSPPFPQVAEVSWKPAVLQNEPEFDRRAFSFKVRWSKSQFLFQNSDQDTPVFLLYFPQPILRKNRNSIWGMEGSPGVLPVIKRKVTKSWWLISTVNQLDCTENPQESTPVCVKSPCAMRVISERLTSRGKTHHECQRHHPMVWVSRLNEKEKSGWAPQCIADSLTVDVMWPLLLNCGCHMTIASWLWMSRDHWFLTVDVTWPLLPDYGWHVTTGSCLWMPRDHCFLTVDAMWPLLPDCGCHVTTVSWYGCCVTTASCSCSFALPAMVDFFFRLWAQSDPSFSYFC